MNARESAMNMLVRINEEGVLCHKALLALDGDDLSVKDRALVTRLVHGTLERQLTCDRILEDLTGKPVSRIKAKLRNLMRMTVYQILFLTQIPSSAAVNEAVNLTKKAGYPFLTGFVNGVLRNLVRRVEAAGGAEAYLSDVEKKLCDAERLSFHYSMPADLSEYFTKNYPEEAEGMFAAFLAEGSFTIRLNQSRGTMEELKESLTKDGIAFTDGLLPNTLRMERTGNLSRTEAYLGGLLSVQDESSALSGNILPLTKEMAVLDLCAAPGGKTIHIADELSVLGGGSVTARDISAGKCDRIREQAERIGLLNVSVEPGDATVFDAVSEEKFDIVIADLPCSGLGVIGRKPDIKYKTKLNDIAALSKLQKSILDNAVRYVKKGGYLCYSTCTVTKEENDENRKYIEGKGLTAWDFSEKIPERLLKRYENGSLQLFPQDGTDGFYMALFRKSE